MKKKTIFDHIAEGNLDDAALARRMKVWMSASKPSIVERAIRLYWKQSDEKRRSLADSGLTENYVRKCEARLKRKQDQ